MPQNGKFNLKDAWNAIRDKNYVKIVYSIIWQKSIPNTIYVFIWRIIQKFIPTDDNLRKRDFILAYKCQCCYHVKNMNHVFIYGPIAVKA